MTLEIKYWLVFNKTQNLKINTHLSLYKMLTLISCDIYNYLCNDNRNILILIVIILYSKLRPNFAKND